MEGRQAKDALDELVTLAMDCLDVGVTIFDPQGILLYYNNYAAKVLDRKPEYIGADIHLHHKKPDTNQKLDFMLQEFSKGRTEPFHYEANPYSQVIIVTLAPIRKSGTFVGCVHCVRLKQAAGPENDQG
ncbi:MAG: PAS domain-containing protein [Thermodesulfobacteriota bacterium]